MLWTVCIAVDYIGCEMQLVLPNARTTLNEKKSCHAEINQMRVVTCDWLISDNSASCVARHAYYHLLSRSMQHVVMCKPSISLVMVSYDQTCKSVRKKK